MSAAAVILIRQRRIVDQFLDAGALSEHDAVPAASLGVRQSFAFRRLVRGGVLVEAPGGGYFVNMTAWQARRHRIRMTGLVLLAVFAAGLLVALAIT